MNSEITCINVEVETLNLEDVKNDLLDYVDKNAKIDITESVQKSKKSASDAELSAVNAANSAVLASEYASQTATDLEQYYSKSQTDALLAGKANIANTLAGYGITDAYTKAQTDGLLEDKADVATTLSGYGITDTYNKTQVDSLLVGKSSTSLSNLSADGQMIIDSQNGTISNCILEIPQNLKLEFSNGTITLKAGSVITRTGSTYSTITTTEDKTWLSSSQANATMYLFATNSGNTGGLYNANRIEKVGSGSSLPADNSTYSLFFNTTDKLIYGWDGNAWVASNTAYPLAIVETDENAAIKGFAKDSNGNDMIFNGAGFVGTCFFVLPNIKFLAADGFTADGKLNAPFYKTSSLLLRSETGGNLVREFGLSSGYLGALDAYIYDEKTNYLYANIISESNKRPWYVKFGHCVISNSVVTEFTIRQPVRMATVEMIDAIDNNSVHLTDNQTVAGVKTFTSSPIISNALPQMQFVDSDFTKGTVPASALRNTFWVLRDYRNTEGANIASLFQRIDESGNNYVALVAFKNESGSNDNVQMGVYYNTDGTSYATCPHPAAGDNSSKIATTQWVNSNFASISGYDATKTQTLKNVSGVLTWVDD